jgi:multidrug efflux pump subunit AcrA (membrane-fusion protein)
MLIPGKILNFIRRQPRWRKMAVAAAALVLVGWWGWPGRGGSAVKELAFSARRGTLEINVLEGGSLKALESQEIKCEVRVGHQGTKILKIVEEGYLVTEADVKSNKVLVELDSSELQKQIAQQEIQYQQAAANLTDAQQNYEIQVNQNQSDIKTAEQKARFARMDFDKFLGDTVTARIIKEHGLDKILTEAGTNSIESLTPISEVRESNPTEVSTRAIDFSRYANIKELGDGEAKQKLRKFEDDLQAAQKELGQAKATLDGTRRLFEKQFVAKTELVRDQLAQDSAELKVKTAETAGALFLKYDFSKTAEQSLSAYTDAVRELDKARRVAISKMAQACAKLKSAQGQYEVQVQQRRDLTEQLGKCTLVAKKTGLVVYGGGGSENYFGNQDPIREGATVRERQAIITIPDLTRMSVNVKIHESYINKIKIGQKVRITVDAFPDVILEGEVSKMGVLPDSQNRWMNPDMMVYLTTITINSAYDWVKPGMSAKVEILVNKLNDVVYIPVQAVSPDDGKLVCYVAGAFKPERREVEAGDFNDEFIEIKKGLKEGERVLLRLPDGIETGSPENGNRSEEVKPGDSKKAAPPAKTKAATPARKA